MKMQNPEIDPHGSTTTLAESQYAYNLKLFSDCSKRY